MLSSKNAWDSFDASLTFRFLKWTQLRYSRTKVVIQHTAGTSIVNASTMWAIHSRSYRCQRSLHSQVPFLGRLPPGWKTSRVCCCVGQQHERCYDVPELSSLLAQSRPSSTVPRNPQGTYRGLWRVRSAPFVLGDTLDGTWSNDKRKSERNEVLWAKK